MSQSGLYQDLVLPDAPAERPYLFINMVSTLDGKITTGERDEPIMDLGSPLDHATMRVLEAKADAIMIGAGTLRATPKLWYPAGKWRVVVTASGRIDPGVRFFTDYPERVLVVTRSRASLPSLPEGILVVESPLRTAQDWSVVLKCLRDMGVSRLLVEGGGTLNADLFRFDLVDELFLTLAPKVKLGQDVPTLAEGDPLDRAEVKRFKLVSCLPVEDEVFLRYAK